MVKHIGKIGSHWLSKNWVHGPRRHQPSLYKKFRVKVINPNLKFVFGLRKSTGKWEIQSELRRRK